MLGPVSSTGRSMMASLQQAIQKGMPVDQAIAYVKGMATQGVAPLTDLYTMMNQFQRLQQQQAKPPQTPPTIKDTLGQMDMQQRMQQQLRDQMQQGGNIQQMQAGAPAPQPMDRGLGAIDAGRMQYPQFAGGGIVAFADGGDVVHMADGTPKAMTQDPWYQPVTNFFGDVARGFAPVGGEYGAEVAPFQSQEMYDLSKDPSVTNDKLIAAYRKAVSEKDPKAEQLGQILINRNLAKEVERANVELAPNKPVSAAQQATALGQSLGVIPKPAAPAADKKAGGKRAGTGGASAVSAVPDLRFESPEGEEPGVEKYTKMIEAEQKRLGIGKASEAAREMLRKEAEQEERLSPEQRRLALAQAGFGMAEAYSRRGRERVSGLGGVGEAGKAYAASLQNINKELRDAARARTREQIAIDRADELVKSGNVQAALQMRKDARNESLLRTEMSMKNLNERLDRDLKSRLGFAQIAAQDRNTLASVRQKAVADYTDYITKLQTNPKFVGLDEDEQNAFLSRAYDTIVNSVVTSLGGAGSNNPYANYKLVSGK